VGARNANEAVVGPVVGFAFGGGQVVGFVLVRQGGNWLQSPWRCFHI
jgi:hypothetical protein